MRVVSLIASSTEIVCALGLGELLVGRSHECDFPAQVRGLPVCTETKFRTDGTSYEIDQRIKAILQEGLSVYRVLAERLRELGPQVILTQTQCEVCAVSERDVEEAVRAWLGADGSSGLQIVSLRPNALADVWDDILRVARALGHEERGLTLVNSLKERITALANAAKTAPSSPSIACIEWIDPLMAAGNWVPELVELACGRSLFGQAGLHSPWLKWDELVASDPDNILVLPCGFDIERTRSEMPGLTDRPGWSKLRAVREGRVYLADGNQYFNRPGPRLVESLEILCEILHPEIFPPHHQLPGHLSSGAGGWCRFFE